MIGVDFFGGVFWRSWCGFMVEASIFIDFDSLFQYQDTIFRHDDFFDQGNYSKIKIKLFKLFSLSSRLSNF